MPLSIGRAGQAGDSTFEVLDAKVTLRDERTHLAQGCFLRFDCGALRLESVGLLRECGGHLLYQRLGALEVGRQLVEGRLHAL